MRPSRVEVDLTAVAANAAAFVDLVAPATMCAVVKADGYGHGDVPVAEAALDGGARMLAVALVEEGVRLREAGVDAPILILSEPPHSDVDDIVRWDLTPTVYTEGFLEVLSSHSLGVHVKVDTGMHRVGNEVDVVRRLVRNIDSTRPLRLEGLWTHFAVADEDESFTKTQIAAFEDVLAGLKADGMEVPMRHAANTAGTLLFPSARFDMVRIGLGLYGLHPQPGLPAVVNLEPAMRVVSAVGLVRSHPAGTRPSYGRIRPLPGDSLIASVPIGYADGVPRSLGAAAQEVLIRGRRHPLAGSVTMDQIVVDIGRSSVSPGDEVVLIGKQGTEEIGADEWAAAAGTISYEIVCRIGPRLPRRYIS